MLEVDSSLLLSIENHAVRLARDAGALLLDSFQRKLAVEYKSKGEKDPVTEADRNSEELLRAGIQRQFPDDGIVSEETPEPHGLDRDFVWIVDPLDGTTNFLNRFPIFGVSIGVLYRGIPVVGALFVPSPLISGGQVIHARLGGGAFADDTPVQVYQDDRPSSGGLVAMPAFFWHQYRLGAELRRRTGEVRVTGSITYELALVASGALQYAAFGGPKIWDVAAGVAIIREAGGDVLSRSGRRPWQPLRSFLEPGTGLPGDGDLRKWSAGLLVGNPLVVALVARNLRPRSRIWRWLRRMAARSARARAREQPSEDRVEERLNDPQDSLSAGEQHPSHRRGAES